MIQDPDWPADHEFGQAHSVVLQDLTNPLDRKTVEIAARTMAQLAIDSGDRLKMACLLARFEDYVNANRAVPPPILTAINKAFIRFRQGESMDEAFGLRRDRPGRQSDFGVREWARTNAAIVGFWRSKGDTLEVAVERAAEMRKQSESQIKRDYLRYRRRIK